MRYLHYILDADGTQIETLYSAFENPKISLETLRIIVKGHYKIWDRETNKITLVSEYFNCIEITK